VDEKRLETFVAVARRLSFTDAARVLHLSQPAVSQQVAALEIELGATLLHRTTRRVELTSAGAALLVRSEALLREFAEARRAVATSDAYVGGDLLIAASLTVGSYLLPPALVELRLRHPALRARVTVENSEQVIDSLLVGKADIGFIEGDVSRAGVTFHPLREDELVLIAPPNHRFAGDGTVAVRDLIEEPFVLREAGSGTRQIAEKHLRAAGVDPSSLNVVAELSSIDAIKTAVTAGLGVSIISRSALATRNMNAAALVQRRIDGLNMIRLMAAATAAGSTLLPGAAQLLAVLAPDKPVLG
jgi:LysR family transcriptional regulator, transcriptional activator of the cysJI operon